jgi:hypothetical protein
MLSFTQASPYQVTRNQRCARSAGTIILKRRLERSAPTRLHAPQRLHTPWTQSAVIAERSAARRSRQCLPCWSAARLAGHAPVDSGVMADDAPRGDAVRGQDEVRELPRHLAVLIGALTGPPDLGRNHDKYLALPRPGRGQRSSVRVILCDTGPLVAAFNQADSDHARCTEFLAAN